MNSKMTNAHKVKSGIDDFAVELFESMADLGLIRDEWDQFVQSSGSDIYFTFDWIETWWEYYGRGRDLRCFLIRRSGRPVAALPFFIERHQLGPFGIRVAKFVGADFTLPVFTPAIDHAFQAEILQTILEDLLVKQRCAAVSLSPLSGTSDLAETAQEICMANPAFRIARADSAAVHTIFNLPVSFDEYLKSLAKQTRSNFRRDLRNTTQRQELEHRVVHAQEAGELFDVFVSLHQEQWRAEGKLGHFGDWPDSAAFNRDLAGKLAKKDQVRIYEMIADGETISIQFGFVQSNKYYWRLPARKVDEKWAKAGIGRLALVKMLNALIDENIEFVEAGPGHYDYKIKHGGAEYPLRRLVITHSRFSARAKTAVMLSWSDLLHLVYYRIWFMKLSPRMNLPRKPLWRAWIRTRL